MLLQMLGRPLRPNIDWLLPARKNNWYENYIFIVNIHEFIEFVEIVVSLMTN